MKYLRLVATTIALVAMLASLAAVQPRLLGPVERVSYSAVSSAESDMCPPAAHCAPPQSEQEFTNLFTYILAIPDDILKKGDQATNEWIRKHPRRGGASSAPGDNARRAFFDDRPAAVNVYRCTLAIAALFITVALPATKILKLKREIEAFGGVIEAVRHVLGGTFAVEKTRALLLAGRALISELLGIGAVQLFCFS